MQVLALLLNMMIDAKITWITHEKGGRKTVPPEGRYFAVAKFQEDIDWQSTAWSVVFDLKAPVYEHSTLVSYGKVRFLADSAPQDRMIKGEKFEIYEGPKKVGDVSL
jgi:hypothetical protein